jgi:hypothetical protein
MAKEKFALVNRQLWRIQLLQYIIHVLPFCAVIIVISLNFIGIYVGNNSEWLPLLQFVAKLLEITTQISIVKITSSYLQYEISNEAIPLGAVFAALQVTTVSYLWSAEFWGGLTSPVMPIYRKLKFAISIVFGILLASGIGPSSAIALIPREGTFPAGRTNVWINTTANQLFPVNLTGSMVPPNCSSATSQPFLGDECPSSEWPAIALLLSAYPGYTLNRWDTLQTSDTTRNLLVDAAQDGTVKSAFATVPPASIAEAMQNVADLWWDTITDINSKTSLGRFKTTSDYIHTADITQPYVLARCIPSDLGKDEISFPNRIETQGSDGSSWTNSTIPTSSIANVAIVDQPYFKVHWQELPDDQFLNISIGAIITSPLSVGGNDSQSLQVLACSIYAGYGSGSLNLTLLGSEIISSHIPGKQPTNDFLWSLERLKVTSEWASSLTAPVDQLNITVDSAIYATMDDVLSPDMQDPEHPEYFHEALLAGLVANGIGRFGFSARIVGYDASNNSFGLSGQVVKNWLSGSNHNIFDVREADSRGLYQLVIRSNVEGLSYSLAGVPIKIALAVLLLYCSLELLYLVYVTRRGFHLRFWDTVAGLTIVALGSPKSEICHQASAGMPNDGLFKEPVHLDKDNGCLQISLDTESYQQSDALSQNS